MSTTTTYPTPSDLSASFVSFDNLSIISAVFSILSALFGVYVVLFVLAIWSTYKRSGLPYRNLRIVTIVLFVVLLVHYICRSITMAQSRLIRHPADETRMVTVPIVFIGALTSTFAGFISDGLLAWRFYVVYGRKRWALYIPATAIIMNGLLGFSGDFQHFTFYHSTWLYKVAFEIDVLKITVAWGWLTFTINTVLGGGIIGKIIQVARNSNKHNVTHSYNGSRCNTALEAVVESAFVTWIGLLLYLITGLAPTGHITTVWNVGYVMLCVMPIFFGISQCLITARLGFANDAADRPDSNGMIITSTPSGASTQSGSKELTITVFRETETDAEKGFVGTTVGPACNVCLA
ncbi:hypothetical protein BDY19DRAFT_356013 [Irpex rosettiformis]|uniref:Uncharacterized protein n=1 Tax=Irpex rosettiformis TaxID=378272 RepID=A0ACB8TWH9_9APHY|nr:hypothetical protein BDY19DRAFT_356013 [Irpex rosettiformis]